MSFYDDNPLLLSRPRPFWEEEEEPIVPPVVVPPPVAPPAAPPPEVEGPGYASLEDIPVAKEAPAPEVVGPGYASLKEIPEEQPPPAVEGPGYASLDDIPGAAPSFGDVVRAGYRALVAPYTEPLEMVGREGEALMPKGSRRAEFRDRIKRNFATGMEETKAAARQIGSGLLSAEQNPYVNKSVAEAKSDVPLLEKQIAEEEKAFRAAGGDPELVGQEWSIEPLPELRGQSQKIGGLRRRLAQARETSTGTTTESFAGALSRSAEDIAQANRDRKAEIIKEYEPLINKAHDKELWMQVADSLGSSGPSMVGSMINPLFGLGLMYAQTFETSRAEFLEKGGDPAKADEYGHAQAAIQTPMEVLGELPLAGVAKGALKRLVQEGNPAAWAKWIKESAVELGESFAGEVGFTTPGQTVAEQKIGEAYGVKPPKTDAELLADVWEAQKVAGLQVGVAGGGPLAVEAGTRLATQGVAAAPTAPVSPAVPGEAAPPPIPPTPDEAFAPGVTITPAPGEVPVPADLAGAPAVPSPGVPPVVPAGDERFAPPPVAPPAPEIPSPVEPAGQRTPEGDAVVQQVGAENLVVKGVADAQAQKLEASNAPETAKAIQQVAARSNTGATVSAAEFLQQAKAQLADEAAAAAEAAAKAAPAAEAPAAAPGAVQPGEFAQPGYTAAAPAPAPQAAAPAQVTPAAPPTETPPAAVVVGGQVFTGATHEEAARAAHAAVGTDAMASASGGWVDASGRFISHDIYEAHQDLNTAIEQSGGNMEAPAVAEAQAQLAEAVARDDELNAQIVQPGGEQVVRPGIKGQEAVIAVRPSQELAVPLAGISVSVEGVNADGQPVTAQRPAAQALNEARNDRTGLQILLNCLT